MHLWIIMCTVSNRFYKQNEHIEMNTRVIIEGAYYMASSVQETNYEDLVLLILYEVGDLVLLRFLLLFHLYIPVNGWLPCQREDVIMVLQFLVTRSRLSEAQETQLWEVLSCLTSKKKTPLSALKNTFNCANGLSMFCAWLDITSRVQNF